MLSGSAYLSTPPDALGDEIWTPFTATPTPPTTVACLGVALKTVVRGIGYVVVVGTSVFAKDVRFGSSQSTLYWGTLFDVIDMSVPEQEMLSVGSVYAEFGSGSQSVRSSSDSSLQAVVLAMRASFAFTDG